MIKIELSKSGVVFDDAIKSAAQSANETLANGSGKGNDFLGWVSLPTSITSDEISAIKAEAQRLRGLADVIICIGIGGSYLGARSVLEALSNPFKLLDKSDN